jgi:transposase
MAQSKSYIWGISNLQQSAQPAVLFYYSPARSGNTPKPKLNDFSDTLMVNGFEGYQAMSNEGQLIHLGCWALVRRKSMDAKSNKLKISLAVQIRY